MNGAKTLVLLASWLVLASAAARAQLDPEVKKPYQLQVVLHIAENRFLTPLFHDQMEREIRAQLQLALGKLANVEIVREHPLLRQVLSKGLQETLDGWKDLSDRTTCFVLIDFAAGEYRVHSRMQDGMTGLASPGVRPAQTADRRHVADTAVSLITRDFGVCGTVTGVAQEVEVTLRGGALDTALSKWVKPGEVFAVVRITHEGGKLRAARIPWTVLQVIAEPREGKCACRLLRRFAEDRLTEEPGVVGYRCLRLPTITGPLRLRLIDAVTFDPLHGLQVHVRARESDKPREYTTNREGLVTSADSFAHVVQIDVLQGSTPLARFPVELVDDRAVTCRLKTSALAESQAPLEYRRDQWVRRLYDNLRVASERVAALSQLADRSPEAARDAARAGLKSMESEIPDLEAERSELITLAREKKLPAERFLAEGNQRLQELLQRQRELAKVLAQLDRAVGSAKTNALLARAQLLENDADIEQALQVYDKAITLLKEPPLRGEVAQELEKVETYVAQLRKAWTEERGPEHVQARAFVYQTWPLIELAKLQANLPKARQALEACRKAEDRRTLRKLALVSAAHAANLKKRLDVLLAKESSDNRAEAARIVQVAEQLIELVAEIGATLRNEKK